MRSSLKYIVSFLIITILGASIYAAASATSSSSSSSKQSSSKSGSGSSQGGNVSLGGIKGPGTDAASFDDNSLIYTPVPTVTPIFTVKTPDIEAWRRLSDTKSLLNRCKKDLARYDKAFRADFMKALNGMGAVVASIHTEALLDKRDQVENAWENSIDPTEHSLALAEEWNGEFNEDYKQMEKNQKRVTELLKKFSSKIQNPAEVKEKFEQNKEEMFFVRKDIDSFGGLFKSYTEKYQAMIKTKEEKVDKLLNDHYELYKP
ncbi:MAG: hypothetical protein ABSA34_03460 [Candidatus Goldiibacteriota bacterium]|jgi:hypothetical protein